MNKKFFAVLCLVSFLGAAGTSVAATTEPHAFWTKQEYAKLRTWAKHQPRRSVADLDKVDVTALSDSLNNLRSEIIGGPKYKNKQVVEENAFPGVHSPEELDALLVKLGTSYDGLDPDAKWVAAQLLPLRVYRGIFARTINLLKNAKYAHSMVAASLRLATTGVSTYLPAAQWKVAVQYMSKPYSGMIGDIDSEDQLLQFLQHDVYGALNDTIGKLNALKFDKAGIYFDNQILYGMGDYPLSDQDRFVLVGEPERLGLIGSMSFTASALASACAYNMHGLMESIKEMSNLFGYDVTKSTLGSIFNGDDGDPGINGVSSKQRTKTLLEISKKYGLFKLNADGTTWMNSSYVNLVNGVMATRASWDLLHKPGTNSSSRFVLNPQAFLSQERLIETSMSSMEQLLNLDGKYKDGIVPLQSVINSKDTVKVNLAEFFLNPPKDLTKFFPTDWDPSAYDQTETLSDGSKHAWHNYLSGSPILWDVTAYQPYFPGTAKPADVQMAARVFAQAWGGWIVGIPFSMLVF